MVPSSSLHSKHIGMTASLRLWPQLSQTHDGLVQIWFGFSQSCYISSLRNEAPKYSPFSFHTLIFCEINMLARRVDLPQARVDGDFEDLLRTVGKKD
jgi:hypothetical protein